MTLCVSGKRAPMAFDSTSAKASYLSGNNHDEEVHVETDLRDHAAHTFGSGRDQPIDRARALSLSLSLVDQNS